MLRHIKVDVLKQYYFILPGILLLASCAKEMLPNDQQDGNLETYNKLYFTEAFAANSVNKKIYTTDSPDTTFYYSITLGGNTPVSKDVNIDFSVLSQNAVDAYNTDNKTSYALLPDGSFTFTASAILKTGQTGTQSLPLTINKSKLSPYINYILPVKFSSSDTTLKVDANKQTIYYIIRMVGVPKGEKIGNIPQLQYTVPSGTKAGVQVFDFYGDLMMRDTLGNLWLYPLESNGGKALGTPQQITFNGEFKNYEVIIFNGGYQKLVALSNILTGTEPGWAYTWSVTPYPNVTIGPKTVALRGNWGNIFRFQRFYSTIDGGMAGIFQNGANWSHNFYSGFDAAGIFTAGVEFGLGSWGDTTAHKSQCFISNNRNPMGILTVHNWGLLFYKTVKNSAGNMIREGSQTKVGDGFYPAYRRIISIYSRDVIAQKYNGDIIRYKNFNIDDFYKAL